MPSYNSARYIGKSIESIINQTYPNWELLITDDCSTDDTIDTVNKYTVIDNRVNLFVLNNNSGPGEARNNSIKNAKGRFIAFCDSDDSWSQDKLAKQLAFMELNHYKMVFSSFYECDEDDQIRGLVTCRKKVTYKHEVIDDAMGCLTVIYDTKDIGKVFFPTIRKRQDWAYKLRVLAKCREAYGMKEPLAYYRIREGSVSRNKLELIKYNRAIYRDELQFGNIGSILMLLFVFIPYNICKKIARKIHNIVFFS